MNDYTYNTIQYNTSDWSSDEDPDYLLQQLRIGYPNLLIYNSCFNCRIVPQFIDPITQLNRVPASWVPQFKARAGNLIQFCSLPFCKANLIHVWVPPIKVENRFKMTLLTIYKSLGTHFSWGVFKNYLNIPLQLVNSIPLLIICMAVVYVSIGPAYHIAGDVSSMHHTSRAGSS